MCATNLRFLSTKTPFASGSPSFNLCKYSFSSTSVSGCGKELFPETYPVSKAYSLITFNNQLKQNIYAPPNSAYYYNMFTLGEK